MNTKFKIAYGKKTYLEHKSGVTRYNFKVENNLKT